MVWKRLIGVAMMAALGMMSLAACATTPNDMLVFALDLSKMSRGMAAGAPQAISSIQAAPLVVTSVPAADDGVRVAQANQPEDNAQAGDSQAAGDEAMSEDELVSMGEEVYETNCATCHQSDGQGAGAYPALAGNSFVTAEDPTDTIEIVVHGRGGMPSFGDQLSAEAIAAAVSYIRNAWENNASAVTVADVQQVQDGEAAAEQQGAGQAGVEQQSADEEGAAQEETQPQEAGQDSVEQAQPAGTQQAQPGDATPVVIQIQIVLVTPTPEGDGGESRQATPQAGEQDTQDTEEGQAAGETEATPTPTPTPATGDGQEQTGEAQQEAAAVEDVQAEEAQTEEGQPESAEVEDAGAQEAGQEEQQQQATGQVGAEMQTGSAVQPNGTLPGEPSIQLVKVAEGLIDPVNVAAPDDGSGRLFIVERVGRIRIVQDGELLEEPFLDISANMKIDFLEQGLLGLAFHPDYANNGRFFVYYTDWRTNGDSVLAEFQVSEGDPNRANPDSVQVLLTHDQPYVNHNGGNLIFGPDGYLYLGLGDGGLAGDPHRTAQNLENLLGAIIRIDVDTENRRGYTIPDDNPFPSRVLFSSQANNEAQDGDYIPNARPEIWVYGLRNPWQFSFDRETGDLYIADVGQGAWEEINFVPAGEQGGQNFGWPHLEGSHCYLSEDCQAFGELPVAEYANPDQGCSITGIGVYRGEQSSSLDGIYFASDYCSGRLWGLMRDEGGAWQFAELLDTEFLVAGAGEDAAGELYLTDCGCQFGRDYDPYEDPSGTVWRIVASDQVPEGAETAPTGE